MYANTSHKNNHTWWLLLSDSEQPGQATRRANVEKAVQSSEKQSKVKFVKWKCEYFFFTIIRIRIDFNVCKVGFHMQGICCGVFVA